MPIPLEDLDQNVLGKNLPGFIIRAFRLGRKDLLLLCFLGHSGDLLLWVGVRRHASRVVRRPLTSSSQELLSQSLPNLVCSICRLRRQEIVNFMTPGAGALALGCCQISQIVKMHYFFKNLLRCSHAQIRQTKYIAIMTNEGSTKTLNFMTPGAGVFVLGCGHISHIVKMHYFF